MDGQTLLAAPPPPRPVHRGPSAPAEGRLATVPPLLVLVGLPGWAGEQASWADFVHEVLVPFALEGPRGCPVDGETVGDGDVAKSRLVVTGVTVTRGDGRYRGSYSLHGDSLIQLFPLEANTGTAALQTLSGVTCAHWWMMITFSKRNLDARECPPISCSSSSNGQLSFVHPYSHI